MKDLAEVKKLCALFISAMEDNRPNCDDAGVARRILEELAQYQAVDEIPFVHVVRHIGNALSARQTDSAEDMYRLVWQSPRKEFAAAHCMMAWGWVESLTVKCRPILDPY